MTAPKILAATYANVGGTRVQFAQTEKGYLARKLQEGAYKFTPETNLIAVKIGESIRWRLESKADAAIIHFFPSNGEAERFAIRG